MLVFKGGTAWSCGQGEEVVSRVQVQAILIVRKLIIIFLLNNRHKQIISSIDDFAAVSPSSIG
jgi:hypothetical protein